jgi:hypothetical protein
MNQLESDGVRAAADVIMRQSEEAAGEYGIPVDPDVADFMGAFQEDALNEQGEVGHV